MLKGVHTVYLSLGTNLGDKEQNLLTAIAEIGRRIGPIKAQSAFLATEPWGFESENTFLNAAIRIETNLSPIALLDETQQIERDMGRTQKTSNPKTPTVNRQLSTTKTVSLTLTSCCTTTSISTHLGSRFPTLSCSNGISCSFH